MDSGIYIIKNNINDKVYIGSAINIKRRIGRHFSELKHNKHGNIIFQRLYNKYADTIALSYEILENCNTKDLIQKEQFYIDSCKNSLLNINKIANSRTGVTNSVEHNQKISNTLLGHKLLEETKIKISNTLKGKKLSQETIEKKYVKVSQFSLDGGFIRTWNSIKEASETLNIERNRITYSLINYHLPYKESYWRYFNVADVLGINILSMKNKRKVALIENDKIVKEFESIKDAASELKLNSSKIVLVCKGERKQTGGLKFKYID